MSKQAAKTQFWMSQVRILASFLFTFLLSGSAHRLCRTLVWAASSPPTSGVWRVKEWSGELNSVSCAFRLPGGTCSGIVSSQKGEEKLRVKCLPLKTHVANNLKKYLQWCNLLSSIFFISGVTIPSQASMSLCSVPCKLWGIKNSPYLMKW